MPRVITYASFRANVPPPANSRFGKVPGEGMVSGCTSPAALGGGSGELHAYLSNGSSIVSNVTAEKKPWVTPGREIATPFVSLPGLLTAECMSKAAYKEIGAGLKPGATNARRR